MYRHPLILVVKDLWYFVTSEVRYWLPLPNNVELLTPRHQQLLTAEQTPAPLLIAKASTPSSKYPEEVTSDLEYESEISEYPEYGYEMEEVSSIDAVTATESYYEEHNPSVMYVLVELAVCILKPHRDFDTVLTKFPYGTAVTVTGYQGGYAKVFWSHHEGWIQKDDLTPHKSEVWPHFTSNNIYLAEDTAVKKLRLLINDTFYAGELALPLQAGEWVAYRLREQNRIIPWSVTHGRVPGDWQALLKGVPGIHIGITPKSDHIMEWRGDDGIGRVAYVEKVDPTKTLTISVAGYEVPGCLEERVLSETEWRELRPVFIEVL